MSGQHVTLDWGTPKVHLASGLNRIYPAGRPMIVKQTVCGYVRQERPQEGTEDEVDRESICGRCLEQRDQQEEAPR